MSGANPRGPRIQRGVSARDRTVPISLRLHNRHDVRLTHEFTDARNIGRQRTQIDLSAPFRCSRNRIVRVQPLRRRGFSAA